MKYCLKILLSLVLFSASWNSFSQSTGKPVYVIVHGAWGGGWAFKKVDSLLTIKGCIVYRPTLTGQGERVHLASKDIGLSTHINDIVNAIVYEDLSNVILVGHSYGGMVITGVADSIPGRIAKLIYLDALLPEDGETVFKILDPHTTALANRQIKDGFMIPFWVAADKMPPKDVPQSLQTFTDTIRLKNKLRLTIPATYILTVEKGKNAVDDDFFPMAERARKKGWPVLYLDADHNAQWSAPESLTEMLMNIGGR